MQADWEIKSRAHVCGRTGRKFEPGEMFYTLLIREKDGFRREDVCEEAWLGRNDNIEPFSFWRSKYEPPAPPPPEPVQTDDVEGLLRRLTEAKNPANAGVLYVLALMLERKKLLRAMASQDDDLLVFEHTVSGDTFAIPNPRLNISQIPEIQRQVGALLAPPA